MKSVQLKSGLKFVRIMTGGGNAVSELWQTGSGTSVVVKKSTEPLRLKQEYRAICFLWQSGERNIPEPISYQSGLAIYGYAEGKAILPAEVKYQDADRLVSFLNRLHRLSQTKKHNWAYPAAEAALRIENIMNQIRQREHDLSKLPPQDRLTDGMQHFLAGQFKNTRREIFSHIERTAREAGLSLTRILPKRYRTFSPSDFGFHNTLRRKDGELVFVDFEYFGWDDPAKLISDTLLHPRPAIPADLKQYFLDAILGTYREDPELTLRLRIMYPLLALKWCLILLNEYFPEKFQRRQSAAGGKLDFDLARQGQLIKAKKMFESIKIGYPDFPYEDKTKTK